jgi:beta-glucosidase
MPWVAEVSSIIQAWYLGNEVGESVHVNLSVHFLRILGNAIGDIIWGKVNPSGRLPLTFPVCIEDTPAYLNQRSENGKIHYREDLFVGYKHYHARSIQPLFAFGCVLMRLYWFRLMTFHGRHSSYGLSYTTFSFTDLLVSDAEITETGLEFSVSVTVKNDGQVSGSEVAQLYISYPETGITTPLYQLKGFAKAKDVEPGASRNLVMNLDKYALAFWDTRINAWTVSRGKYVINVGASSADFRLEGKLNLTQDLIWKGL